MWMPEIGESVYLKKYKYHAIILNKEIPKFSKTETSHFVFSNKIHTYTSADNMILSTQQSFCYELLIGDMKGWTSGSNFIRAMRVIKFSYE